MNNFKKTGGFTLVELIVVITILGILAAVAIPAYSGYIKKAQDASVITELDAIATAAQAANATAGALDKIVVKDNDTSADTIVVSVPATESMAKDFEANFKMFFNMAEGDATFTACSDAKGETPVTGTAATVSYKITFAEGKGFDWKNTSYAEKGATWTPTGAWS